MEQRSLRVVSTNKNFFTKLTNTISRLLIPTKLGINGIMISIKRSSLVKAFEAYKNGGTYKAIGISKVNITGVEGKKVGTIKLSNPPSPSGI